MSNLPVALLVITDRPHYYEQAMASAAEQLPDNIGARIVINDSDHKLGFAGAIQAGWEKVLQTGCRYVFHLEDDFIFNEPVRLEAMISVLERTPRLAQMALKRQAVNAAEREAGGVVEQYPEDFIEREDIRGYWCEHRRFFTTNPSVYPAKLCELGWPQVEQSEGVFTHDLRADGWCFGYWGRKFDPPRVTHIGEERAEVAHGY